MTTAAGVTTEGTFNPDKLFAGDFPVSTRKVTIATGANLVRGAVLGLIGSPSPLPMTLMIAAMSLLQMLCYGWFIWRARR